ELVALGPAVHDANSSVAEEAQAVAQETMRRARYNIELLIRRLHEVGYRFGYCWCTADERAFLERELAPPPPFAEPDPDIGVQLDTFESAIGPLPLSVRAWYEQIGAVNFVGAYPVEDPTDPEGFAHWQQVKSADARSFTLNYNSVQAERPCQHDLDPLWIYPLVYNWNLPRKTILPEWALAPDEYFKLGQPGGGYYTMLVPNAVADARVDYEWHRTSFVAYLRTCFRWGGFPGLECKRRRPEK